MKAEIIKMKVKLIKLKCRKPFAENATSMPPAEKLSFQF